MSRMRLSYLAVALAGIGSASIACASLGPIRVLSSSGEAFKAEIPVDGEFGSEAVQVGLADRSNSTLLSDYSPSASTLHFAWVNDNQGKRIIVTGPVSISEPKLRFAVALSDTTGSEVREYNVDYRQETPQTPLPAGDETKEIAALGYTPHRIDGLGLGDIKVLSHLGEPLHIELLLLGNVLEQVQQPQITLYAPPVGSEGYSKSLLEIIAKVTSHVERIAYGQYRLHLRTVDPVHESILHFLLEVTAGKQKAGKEYTVLIDPTGAHTKQVTPTTVPSSVNQKTPITLSGLSTYRIQSGDTLWGIANRIQRSGQTMERVRQLFNANPEAFVRNNMNRLIVGAVLKYPANWDMHKAQLEGLSKTAAQHTHSVVPPAIAKPTVNRSSNRTVSSKVSERSQIQQLNQTLAQQNEAFKQINQEIATLENQIHTYQIEPSAAQQAINQTEKRVASVPVMPTSEPLVTPDAAALQALNQGTSRLEPKSAPTATTPSSSDNVLSPALPAAMPMPESVQHGIAPSPADTLPRLQPHSDILDDLTTLLTYNGVLIGTGGATAAVVLGMLLAKRRRRNKMADEYASIKPSVPLVNVPTTKMQSVPQAAAIEEAPTAAVSTEATGLDLNPTDYLAEAEVYMAYARYDQAIEILHEGIQHEPMRQDLRTRILDIMAQYTDQATFIAEASAVKETFGTQSALWRHAYELGRQVAPNNALFAIPAAAPTSFNMGQASTTAPISGGIGLGPMVLR